ncbi:MAG: hypothetical protein RSA79_00655 [Oscillospiraceae bacterium]
MPKNLFEIRNKTRLFNGISYAVVGLSSVYTLINIFVINTNVKILGINNLSKYFLICFPVISIIICIMMIKNAEKIMSNKAKIPLAFKKTNFSSENKKTFNRLQADTNILINLIFQVMLLLTQVQTIYNAKGIQKPAGMLYIIFFGLIIFVSCRNMSKCLKISK